MRCMKELIERLRVGELWLAWRTSPSICCLASRCGGKGRPVRHSLFRPQDGLLVPISILIFGFSVYDEVSYFMRAADGRDSLASFGAWWGLPVALLGLYLIVGRFVVRAIVSRRTRYVLTDQRLLVIGGLSGTRTTSTYPRTLRSNHRVRP